MLDSSLAPLAAKLSRLGLTADEQSLVLSSVATTRQFNAREVVSRQDEAVPHLIVLLDGLAARFKLGPNGERQIMAFSIPGDLCTAQIGVTERLDHGVVAISHCTFALVPRRTLTTLVEEQPKLALALWRDTVADAAVEREWLFNLGRRNAFERIAHVLCEVHSRLEGAGLAPAASFDFAVTQGDLADAMGLSVVHVNRSLTALKQAGLIAINRGRVRVLDREALTKVAAFDASYLAIETSRRPSSLARHNGNSGTASNAPA